MEFKSLNNIESSFRQLRLFSIIFLVMCSGVMCFAVWKAYEFAEAQRQKIYVLDDGKSLMLALSQDLSQNRPVSIISRRPFIAYFSCLYRCHKIDRIIHPKNTVDSPK